MILRTLFLLLGAFSCGVCHAQQHPILESFSGYVVGKTIVLDWVIKQGNTCNGIQINRSINEEVYEQVGEIVGICGAPATSVKYSFTDSFLVANAKHSYQLTLGVQGFSQLAEVNYTELNASGYNLFPNPVVTDFQLHFVNPTQEECLLFVYDEAGRVVINGLTTTAQFMEVSTAGLGSGSYSFVLERADERLAAGAFVKVE